MKKFFLENPLSFVLSHQKTTIFLSLILMLICASQIGSLGNSRDFRDLFNKDNPELLDYDKLNNIYANGSADSILIAVEPIDDTVFSKETLGVIEELTARSWLLPYAIRVDSLTNYSHSRAEGDDLIIENLVRDLETLTEEDLNRIERIALNTPELRGRLVSNDGLVGGLVINFAVPDNRSVATTEVNDNLETLLSEIRELNSSTNFYAVGEMVTNRAFTRTTESELAILVPTALMIILITAWIISRSVICTLVTLLLMIFTVMTALGIAGWFKIVLTPISAYIPIVLMAFSVAYSIHIITGTITCLRRGMEKREAITNSIEENSYPVFLTSVTTIIGFLSLNFSDLPPFSILGNFVAIGVGFNFLYSMTLLPALLAILPLKQPKKRDNPLEYGILKIGDFVVQRKKQLLFLMSAAVIIYSVGIFRIELSDNFLKYYGERHEFRQNMEFVINNFTGLDTQEYSLDTKEENGITDPEYLETLDRFAEWFRQNPGVHHVWSFSDTMKRLNQNMHGDDPENYKLPDDRSLAAQYLLLYELSLPFGKDLNNYINVSKSSTRFVVTLRDLSSREQRELAENGYAWLEENAPSLLTKPSGFSVVLAYLTERSVRSMLAGTAVAAILVSIILLMVFRSVQYGLVSLVPNFVPGIMAIGLWGYFVGNIGIAAAVFVVISFGIIVDDTIHFMTRYLKALRVSKVSAENAVLEAFRGTGLALLSTTIILALGFGVFAFSSFQPNWSLGGLVTTSITLALLMDFLLLPPLLMLVSSKKDIQ